MLNSTTRFDVNVTVGLNNPTGISVIGTDVNSIVVADLSNSRIVALWNIGTTYENVSVVATEWEPNRSLCYPYYLHINVRNGYNLYVSDYCYAHVIMYTNMQSVNPPPLVVAGTNHTGGVGLQFLDAPFGIQLDSNSNLYVAAMDDHFVTLWAPNATIGILVAGLGIQSSTSMGLSSPAGIALDERDSFLYVVDSGNHRIQRYSLNETWPCNGTTVAGGNGAGSGSHQLLTPRDVWISKKTKAVYIADTGNHRIQRWNQGATEGVTIAGDPRGISGSGPTQLANPRAIALNANETYMYVTDRVNNRVQRFRLI